MLSVLQYMPCYGRDAADAVRRASASVEQEAQSTDIPLGIGRLGELKVKRGPIAEDFCVSVRIRPLDPGSDAARPER